MIPFYTQDNEVDCKFSGITHYSGGLLANGQSYMNYERIDIEFEGIPTGVGDSFQLLIPT